MAGNSAWIIERARSLGFDLCGIVRPEKFPELRHFQEWLARGYAGEMRYLQDPRRTDLLLTIQDVRSVIVCALNYNTKYPYSNEAAGSLGNQQELRGWVSRYAWGDDYHQTMWDKLNALTSALRERLSEPFTARAYADTGPVAERVLAKHAGLGWLGKNTLLLNEKLGSWLFLGVILTSLDLESSVGPPDSLAPDLCGNCRQCLDACPTEALVEPYVLDARQCISYLTIELRSEIPPEFRTAIGWQVYGCDICQDVCPYNHAAPVTSSPAFQPRETSAGDSLFVPRLEWLAGLTEEEFRDFFRGSAMKRAKWAGLVRNACIALGNSHLQHGSAAYGRIVALLEHLAVSTVSSIAESARWALSRIKEPTD